MRSVLWLWVAALGCGTDGASRSTGDSSPSAGADGSGGEDSAGTAPACDPSTALLPGREGCAAAAACAWRGDQQYGFFGYDLDAGPDFDGDGAPDLLVGAPYRDAATHDGSNPDAGGAFVVSGAHLGEEGAGLLLLAAGPEAGARAGTSVALLPDLQGDGYAELLAGAPGVGDGQGAVLFVPGQPLSPSSGVTVRPQITLFGTDPLGAVGTSLAVGDLDGDGLADVATNGALRTMSGDNETWSSGKACVWAGADIHTDATLDALPCWSASGTRDAAGHALATGDLDGDGYADLVVGAPYAGGSGRVAVVPGSASLVSGGLEDARGHSGEQANEAFGWSVAVGDLDGDGQVEVAVGAPLRDAAWGNEGAVDVLGGATLAPMGTFTGDQHDGQLGTGLMADRDLTGDGVHDLVFGAVSAWEGVTTRAGRVGVWPGGAFPDAGSWDDATTWVRGAATKDYLGRAAAAADFNQDGAVELALGSAFVNLGSSYDAGEVVLFGGRQGD